MPGRQRVHVRHRAHAARSLPRQRSPHRRRGVRRAPRAGRAQGHVRHGDRRPGLLRHQRGGLLHIRVPAGTRPPLRPRVLRPAWPGALRRAHVRRSRDDLLPLGRPDHHPGSGASVQGCGPPVQHRVRRGRRPRGPAAVPRHRAGGRGPRGLPPGDAGRAALAVRGVLRHPAGPDVRRRPCRPPGWPGARRHRRPDPGRPDVLRAAGPGLQRHPDRNAAHLQPRSGLRSGSGW